MVFNSYLFILFFLPATLCGFFLLEKFSQYELAKFWLIIASLWFYAYLNPYYAVLLVGSALVNFGLQYLMQKQDEKRRKKRIFILGIAINLAVLFYFKYFNFFIENVNVIFKTDLPITSLILTVGISFITFQQISYLADCYREENMRHGFPDYAAYISFFPKISSGPITQFRELLPQLQEREIVKPRFENLSKGLYQFTLGLAKKVLLADTLAKLVAIGFYDITGLHTGSALLVMLCYSLQLYYDFSGYSDMAVGVALMLNVRLPVNFNSPYKAVSVSDFWKRWHITLTQFFTKYVYIPLGGSRKGLKRTCINIFIIFLLSGIWHGANWTFLVWGVLHGFVMVIERITDRKIEKVPFIGWLFTFLFVNVAWVIFRVNSLAHVRLFFNRIFVPGTGAVESSLMEAMNELVEIRILCRLGLQGLVDRLPGAMLFVIVVTALFLAVFTKNTQERVEKFCYKKRQMAITVLLLVWSIVSLSGVSEFLYSYF